MDKQTYISLAPLCRSAAEAQAARYVHDEAEREDILQDVLRKMWEQHAFSEIACILGTTESSVRGMLCKARARLLEFIKKQIR